MKPYVRFTIGTGGTVLAAGDTATIHSRELLLKGTPIIDLHQ